MAPTARSETSHRRAQSPLKRILQTESEKDVGADAAAVALSEEPGNSEDLVLIVDVGTNAEILLGNQQRVLACSSPTGPAFEGAQISSGQRAAPGAIEKIEIDPITKDPRFRVIGCDLWSDEPGFAAPLLPRALADPKTEAPRAELRSARLTVQTGVDWAAWVPTAERREGGALLGREARLPLTPRGQCI